MKIKPRGRQREVLYLPTEGHHVVLASAGSGKSTVAVLRSRYLADPGLDHAGRVLLVTYTQALTKYLAQLVDPSGPSVDVLTLHTVGRNALARTGARELYDARVMRRLQERAILTFKRSHRAHRLSARPERFFIDEFAWIAGHGIEDATTYVEAERVGRGSARLLRADREMLFDVYTSYLDLRAEDGYDYDLQDMPHQLHLALRDGKTNLPYKHVVIDEAQDFAPEVLRAAAQMIPDGGSLTVFADYAQQIYGRRMSWRSAGLRVSKLWELDGNYRNTKQISAVAAAIAELPGFEADDLRPLPSAYDEGPVPTLTRCATPDAEDRCIAEHVQRFASRGNVAVLTRTVSDRNRLARVLPPIAKKLDRNLNGLEPDGIYYGTLHAAKGLEFDSVHICHCSSDRLPDQRASDALGVDEARAEDLRLLYVGVTRARTNLAISYVGTKSELLPTDPGIFVERFLQ